MGLILKKITHLWRYLLMPAKGRRTASRQGQLKRKKAVKGPSGIPTGRMDTAIENDDAVTVIAAVDEAEFESSASGGTGSISAHPETPTETQARSAARTPRGEFAGQGQNRLRGERPAAYLYVGSEFRRILVLTSVIIGALVVLGIVL